MPEIISYHDRDQGIQSTVDTVSGLGLKRIANILTVLVILAALPVTLIAVSQVNTFQQQAASSTIQITTGIIDAKQIPWVATLTGNKFTPLMHAKVFDGNAQWGSDIPVIFENANKVSLKLPNSQPPSLCTLGKTCNLSVQLTDPSSNLTSNKLPLSVQ